VAAEAGSWGSLPVWFREHYDRYGADQLTASGWHELVADQHLSIVVRGRSLIWVGEGPEHGAELAYRAAPLPDDPEFDPDDLDGWEAWLQARGDDVGELRRLGMLPTPYRPAPDPEFDPDGVEYLNPPRDRSYDD
jgi:hypothetical protein